MERDTLSMTSQEVFESGSVRDSRAGKGRYDLISTYALRQLALRCEMGAILYGEDNWLKGQPLMRYVDSLTRHLHQWIEGEDSEDHLGAVLWNAMALCHTDIAITKGEMSDELDTRHCAKKVSFR